MSIEDAIRAALAAELVPLREELAGVRAELASLRAVAPVGNLVPLDLAAERLGVSVATLRRRIRSGAIPRAAVYQDRPGAAVRLDLSKLKAPEEGEVTRLAHAARAAH
jgi:hypothetical protein